MTNNLATSVFLIYFFKIKKTHTSSNLGKLTKNPKLCQNLIVIFFSQYTTYANLGLMF